MLWTPMLLSSCETSLLVELGRKTSLLGKRKKKKAKHSFLDNCKTVICSNLISKLQFVLNLLSHPHKCLGFLWPQMEVVSSDNSTAPLRPSSVSDLAPCEQGWVH